MSTMLAIVDPGDEVIVFEPFYENYGPDAILSGATPRFVRAARARLDVRSRASWRAAFFHRTRAIIVNTPNNPTGKVFTRAELERSPGCAGATTRSRSRMRSTSTSSTTAREHVPMATLAGMAERTVTINGAVEDLQRDGMARGLDDRARRHHRGRFARCTIS